MSFKEILAEDVNSVFLNLEEFADYHDIDGRQVRVVVDSDTLLKRQLKLNREAGVYDGDLLFFARASDMDLPPIGKVIRFDGRPCRVVNTQEAGGLLTVTLKGTRS